MADSKRFSDKKMPSNISLSQLLVPRSVRIDKEYQAQIEAQEYLKRLQGKESVRATEILSIKKTKTDFVPSILQYDLGFEHGTYIGSDDHPQAKPVKPHKQNNQFLQDLLETISNTRPKKIAAKEPIDLEPGADIFEDVGYDYETKESDIIPKISLNSKAHEPILVQDGSEGIPELPNIDYLASLVTNHKEEKSIEPQGLQRLEELEMDDFLDYDDDYTESKSKNAGNNREFEQVEKVYEQRYGEKLQDTKDSKVPQLQKKRAGGSHLPLHKRKKR